MVSGLPEILRLLSNTVIMQTLAQGQATAIFSSPLKKKKKNLGSETPATAFPKLRETVIPGENRNLV